MKFLVLCFLSLAIGFQSVDFESNHFSVVDHSTQHSPVQSHNNGSEVEDEDDLEEKEFDLEQSYSISFNMNECMSFEGIFYSIPFLEKETRPPRV